MWRGSRSGSIALRGEVLTIAPSPRLVPLHPLHLLPALVAGRSDDLQVEVVLKGHRRRTRSAEPTEVLDERVPALKHSLPIILHGLIMAMCKSDEDVTL
jgi:hypothetical protein